MRVKRRMFVIGDEGLVPLADEEVGAVAKRRRRAVNLVPVVAHHHSLLESRCVGTQVTELLVAETHMVDLSENIRVNHLQEVKKKISGVQDTPIKHLIIRSFKTIYS